MNDERVDGRMNERSTRNLIDLDLKPASTSSVRVLKFLREFLHAQGVLFICTSIDNFLSSMFHE